MSSGDDVKIVNPTTKTSIRICSLVLVICSIVFSLLSLALPITNIVLGQRYFTSCPASPVIPRWLIGQGVIGIVVILVFNLIAVCVIISGSLTIFKMMKQKYRSKAAPIVWIVFLVLLAIFCSLLLLFTFAWFLTGNYYVFSIYNKFQTSDNNLGNYCDPTLYWFSFWSIIAYYIIMVASCYWACCSGFLGLLVACVYRKVDPKLAN